MYIGLISDTHGVFDDEFKNFFEPVDVIWHAGDWGGEDGFSKKISSLKPVVGVYGNCDGQDIRYDYPNYQFFEVEGITVLMVHIGGSPGHYEMHAKHLIESFRPHIFVCGHSHILKVKWDEYYQMMYMNPGAAGIQGWQLVRTALRFKIESGKISNLEVLEVPRT